MFDGFEPLADGKVDIPGGDVVLEIDECLDASGIGIGGQHANRPEAVGRRRGREGAAGAAARRGAAGGKAFGENLAEIVAAIGGAGRAGCLDRLIRDEGIERRVEAQLAARLREQMHRRRPAARHADAIGGQDFPRADLAIGGHWRDGEAGDAPGAGRGKDGVAGQGRDALCAQRGQFRPAIAFGPDIDQRHVEPCIGRVAAPPHRPRRHW